MEVLASEIATILENDSLEMMLTNSILVKDDDIYFYFRLTYL